jgi:hypothetical protein
MHDLVAMHDLVELGKRRRLAQDDPPGPASVCLSVVGFDFITTSEDGT